MKLSAAAATCVAFLCLVGPLARAPFGGGRAIAAPESEDELISQGVALRKRGDDQGARDLFRKAYERSHSPRAAAQLGLAEQALGRWDDAEAHVGEALRTPDDPWVKKNQDTLARSMLVIKSHVARLEILGQPDGAEIVVNGRVVGRLPLAAPVGTSAGEVDIEARAPGYQREVRKLTLVGGQYQRLVVRLEKEEAPATQAPPLATTTPPTPVTPPGAVVPGANQPPGDGQTPDQPTGSFRPIAKWTALGLSGAGLAVGIASSIVRSNKLQEFKSAHGGGCFDMGGRAVDMNGMPVLECQGPLDTYKTSGTWQIVGFVSAGVFAATWLALTLTEPAPATGPRNGVARAPTLVCAPTTDMTGATCMLSM